MLKKICSGVLLPIHVVAWFIAPIIFSIIARRLTWPEWIYIVLPIWMIIWGWLIKRAYFHGFHSLVANFVYFFVIIMLFIFSFIIGQISQMLILGV